MYLASTAHTAAGTIASVFVGGSGNDFASAVLAMSKASKSGMLAATVFKETREVPWGQSAFLCFVLQVCFLTYSHHCDFIIIIIPVRVALSAAPARCAAGPVADVYRDLEHACGARSAARRPGHAVAVHAAGEARPRKRRERPPARARVPLAHGPLAARGDRRRTRWLRGRRAPGMERLGVHVVAHGADPGHVRCVSRHRRHPLPARAVPL
jgi:hypothetical protein